MNLDNYTPKGELEGFPKEVIAKMLEEQVKQGNKEDIEVFEQCSTAVKDIGGFNWGGSELGGDWDGVTSKNFNLFFAKYPKSSSAESKYPKVMMVSDNEEIWHNRVVFMKKHGKYISWIDADTLEEAEHKTETATWKFAKDIEEFQPPTPKTLEERIEAIEKHLNFNQ